MGSEIRYIFGDVLTGEVIEEIPCYGVSINDSLDGGEFRGNFALDTTGKNNADLVAATIPGKTFVVVERNGVPIWGGLNWSRTYQSQAKTAQLYSKTMDQYLTKRFIDEDVSFTGVDRRNIFLALLELMMLDPNSPQWDLPAAFATDVAINYDIAGSELRSYREIVDNLSVTDIGFEWRVGVTKQTGAYSWVVELGYPTLGQPLNDASVVFEYPGNILNYWQNDTLGGSGTNIYAIGAGEGDSMPQVEIVHQDLLDAGFIRLDQDVPLKDIQSELELEGLGQVQAQVRKAPMPVYTVELKADRTPQFSEWVIGDYCKLAFNDPMHPQGLVHPTRILQYEYTPPSSDATEEVRLTFEGEDAE